VRGNFRVYVNYAATDQVLTPAQDEVGYVLGGADIPAAGVTVAKLARGG
jgi:beta-galactosidase